jgi:hypothetical protein
MKTTSIGRVGSMFFMVLSVELALAVSVWAATDDWSRQAVDWRAGAGRHITGIHVPKDRPFPAALGRPSRSQPSVFEGAITSATLEATAISDPNQIDSPPVAGFIINVAVAVTDAKSTSDSNRVAEAHSSVVGSFLTGHPQTDFAMGIFDTGAGFHLLGYATAQQTGILTANLLSQYTILLQGATGSATVWASQPLGVFIDGLSAIDSKMFTVDHLRMVGQSNVVVGVAPRPGAGSPDMGTSVGAPLSVNFAAAIFNDRQITLNYDGNEYTGPDVRFYSLHDPCIPQYTNHADLNLLPAGAVDVEYYPGWPSLIMGTSYQSRFFFAGVDLYKGTRSSLSNRGFLLDTGSQITVISSSIASRLNLRMNAPDFKVEVAGITNNTALIPGFFLDGLNISSVGATLSCAHAPVIVMDNGSLDGIIGTNLFVDFDLVLRGGGLLGQDPPSLAFQHIQSVATSEALLP